MWAAVVAAWALVSVFVAVTAGKAIDVDESYCPDCAAVREDTWGYR